MRKLEKKPARWPAYTSMTVAPVLAFCAFQDLFISHLLYNPGAQWAIWFQFWGVLFVFVPVVAAMAWVRYKWGVQANGIIKATAVTGGIFLLMEQCTVGLLKLLWGRIRYAELLTQGSFEKFSRWFLPRGNTGHTSFPSGHTGFAVGVFLLYCFARRAKKGEKPALVFCIGYVVLMAISRIVLGRHYASDVVAGGLIGGLCMFTAWCLTEPALAWLDARQGKKGA